MNRKLQYLIYLGFGIGAIHRALKNGNSLLRRFILCKSSPRNNNASHRSRLVMAFQDRRTKRMLYTNETFEIFYDTQFDFRYIAEATERNMQIVLEYVDFPARMSFSKWVHENYKIKFVKRIPCTKEEFFIGENDAGVRIKPAYAAHRVLHRRLASNGNQCATWTNINEFLNFLIVIANDLHRKRDERSRATTINLAQLGHL